MPILFCELYLLFKTGVVFQLAFWMHLQIVFDNLSEVMRGGSKQIVP